MKFVAAALSVMLLLAAASVDAFVPISTVARRSTNHLGMVSEITKNTHSQPQRDNLICKDTKVIVITGASQGLGQAMAYELVSPSINICICVWMCRGKNGSRYVDCFVLLLDWQSNRFSKFSPSHSLISNLFYNSLSLSHSRLSHSRFFLLFISTRFLSIDLHLVLVLVLVFLFLLYLGKI